MKIVVTNDLGKPVDRADVIVRFGGRSVVKLGKLVRTTWEMRSSQQGVAEIPEMPKGKIRVQVIAKGYQTFGQTFDVNEDERTIEVQLNRRNRSIRRIAADRRSAADLEVRPTLRVVELAATA